MLTAASLGMALYGLYSILAGVTDLVAATQLEWWANLWLISAGIMLMLGAAFVRVSLPGGLALAVGGLLALQSIGLHNAGHLYGRMFLIPELARAALALALAALAYFGWDSDSSHFTTDREAGETDGD
jgi:hypothetical protein